MKLELDREGLEKATSRNPFLDVGLLQEWCGNVEKRVCRVRCDGIDYGTGFLISPWLVLTCYHVVEDYIGEPDRKLITVCFDNPEGGSETSVIVDPTWDIPFAPYSEHDKRLSTRDPKVEELDFAVLKLSAKVEERGSFSLDHSVRLPRIGEPILIAGHPGPNPPLQTLKFSTAAPGYEGTNGNGTRVIYKTSTEKGSSGSPVFDRKFRLIAMHHNRGQVGGEFYHNNRGIPIKLVLDFLNTSKWRGALEQVGFP